MESKFLCVDIGSSSIKAALFLYKNSQANKNENIPKSIHHKLLSYTRVEYPAQTFSNQDTPSIWVESFQKIVEEFSPKLKQDSTPLYIIISGHGPSTVYIDNQDKVLHYIPWGNDEAIDIPQEASHYIPQFLYVKQKLTHIYEQCSKILGPAEYLSYVLSNKAASFFPENLTFAANIWTEQSLEKHGINKQKLPPPIHSGHVLGPADSALAEQLSISHATLVAGGLDYQSAILGSRCISPQSILQRSGSSVVLNACIDIKHKQEIQENLNNTYYAQLRPFVMPSFLGEYLNLGISVPYYNETYQKAMSHFDMLNTNAEDIFSSIENLDTTHKNIVSHIKEAILHKELDFSQIVAYIAQHAQSEYLGIVYLSVLLEVLKDIFSFLENLVHTYHPTENKRALLISGGHAQNTSLVRLQGLFLSRKILRFNPVYTELLGNLALGIHALDESFDYKNF